MENQEQHKGEQQKKKKEKKTTIHSLGILTIQGFFSPSPPPSYPPLPTHNHNHNHPSMICILLCQKKNNKKNESEKN